MQQQAKKVKFEELKPKQKEFIIDALFTYYSLKGNQNPEMKIKQVLSKTLRTKTKWSNYANWKNERAIRIREKFGLKVVESKSPPPKDGEL